VNVILARRTTLGTERSRYDDSADILDGVAGRPAAPEVSMDFEEAIGRLPDGARQVFVLHDIEGTGTRRSPTCWGSWPARRNHNCIMPAWRSAGGSSAEGSWNDEGPVD